MTIPYGHIKVLPMTTFPAAASRRNGPYLAAASALILAACASLPPAQAARVAKATSLGPIIAPR